ncbi:MAG: hypothetical protein OEM52_11290 [bacterium]|nr:hypothetical protein [bacterium]
MNVNNANLTPEEIERVRREHRELLERTDEKNRAKLRELQVEQEQGEHYDELRRIRFEEEEKLFGKDPRYIVVEDDQGFKSFVLKENAQSRTHRKRVRKKHRRSIRSIFRDYVSIGLIVLVMFVLVYYALQLTP